MLEILKEYGKGQINPKEVARVFGKLHDSMSCVAY